MKHLEDKLQKNCVRWFSYQFPYFRKLIHHSPNGGKRNQIEAAKLKEMGVRAGFPDLILLVPNKFHPFLGIELKTEKGRQSENQKLYQQEIEKVGGKYVIVRSVEEFVNEVYRYLNDKE